MALRTISPIGPIKYLNPLIRITSFYLGLSVKVPEDFGRIMASLVVFPGDEERGNLNAATLLWDPMETKGGLDVEF